LFDDFDKDDKVEREREKKRETSNGQLGKDNEIKNSFSNTHLFSV